MAMQNIKRFFRSSDRGTRLFAGLLVSCLFALPTLAQSAQEQERYSADQASAHVAATHKASPYRPRAADSLKDYYKAIWGIENMLIREVASSNLIRFSYRVTDPPRAKALGNKRAEPLLYGQRSRAVLHVPIMGKVGQLRQSGTAVAGKEYWMVFSNKGNLVKSGDRVNVVIGTFHADGLMVE